MVGSTVQLLSSLTDLVGGRITAVARAVYEYQGDGPGEEGAVEIEVGGRTVVFDAGSNGESLEVSEGPWHDPFGAQPSAENEEFLDRHGWWRRIDCSTAPNYAALVGREITAMRALANRWGRLGGVLISASPVDMWIVVDGDECNVRWTKPDGFVEVG